MDKGFGPKKDKGDRLSREQVEAVRQAMESGDYQAWVSAVQNTPNGGERILGVIDSEEDFNRLAESHQKMQEGDIEGAREIKEELGLPEKRKGPGDKKGGEQRGSQYQEKENEE